MKKTKVIDERGKVHHISASALKGGSSEHHIHVHIHVHGADLADSGGSGYGYGYYGYGGSGYGGGPGVGSLAGYASAGKTTKKAKKKAGKKGR